jgi:translation initiation factor IF-3
MAHQELGTAMLQRIREALEEEVVVEQFPRIEGRQMVMLVSPKRV